MADEFLTPGTIVRKDGTYYEVVVGPNEFNEYVLEDANTSFQIAQFDELQVTTKNDPIVDQIANILNDTKWHLFRSRPTDREILSGINNALLKLREIA